MYRTAVFTTFLLALPLASVADEASHIPKGASAIESAEASTGTSFHPQRQEGIARLPRENLHKKMKTDKPPAKTIRFEAGGTSKALVPSELRRNESLPQS